MPIFDDLSIISAPDDDMHTLAEVLSGEDSDELLIWDGSVGDYRKIKRSNLMAVYALLAGRAGGQTLIGGSAVDDILKLQGTSGNGTAAEEAVQIQVGNNGGTIAATVLNSGNVGIGTTAPWGPLSVFKSSASLGVMIGYGGNDIQGRSGATGVVNDNLILNPYGGNVGIGTMNTGGTKLAVHNNGESIVFIKDTGGSNLAGLILERSGNAKFRVMTGRTSGKFSIGTDARDSDLVVDYSTGNVGIGTTHPDYLLEVVNDSAGKPGAGGVWTVVSDERLKNDISLADLDRCYDIVKSLPLKRFTWKDDCYTEEQVKDRSSLGWISQDVRLVFPKAVNNHPFLKVPVPDGTEEYEEQDYVIEIVEKEEVSIEVKDGKAIQVKSIVKTENKVMLFDVLNVVDENGDAVLDERGNPLMHQVPRMVKKMRPKLRQDVIEDCLDLNSGQIIAAMYGALQRTMLEVENLTKKILVLENKR